MMSKLKVKIKGTQRGFGVKKVPIGTENRFLTWKKYSKRLKIGFRAYKSTIEYYSLVLEP